MVISQGLNVASSDKLVYWLEEKGSIFYGKVGQIRLFLLFSIYIMPSAIYNMLLMIPDMSIGSCI